MVPMPTVEAKKAQGYSSQVFSLAAEHTPLMQATVRMIS